MKPKAAPMGRTHNERVEIKKQPPKWEELQDLVLLIQLIDDEEGGPQIKQV